MKKIGDYFNDYGNSIKKSFEDGYKRGYEACETDDSPFGTSIAQGIGYGYGYHVKKRTLRKNKGKNSTRK